LDSALQPARVARKEPHVKTFIASTSLIRNRVLPVAYAATLALVFATSLSQPAQARDNGRDHDHHHGINPPPVPANIKIPPGNSPFLLGHAVGTQNYICLPAGTGFQFRLFTPRATLFNGIEKQLTTHYFSPNPSEGGTVRAAWEHSRDSSIVWGRVVPGDSATVDPRSIDWLRVTVTGVEEGPTGGDTLTRTTFIHRVNTRGGLAPTTGCTSLADVGAQAFVPYTADYIFYTAY
jgi:hypothetical protein